MLETFGFGVHTSAAHFIGLGDCEADEESWTEDEDTKLFLNADYFKAIHEVFPSLAMNFFHQDSIINWKNVSRRSDPYMFAIDAFLQIWFNDHFLILPFSAYFCRSYRK